jgi:mono/diheme cytochrome c family protein
LLPNDPLPRTPRRATARLLALSLTALALAGTALLWQPRPVSAQTDPAASPEFYTTKVEPIFAANCNRCHAGMNHRGGYSMVGRDNILKGGHDGVAIVPGHPEDSMLVRLITHNVKPDDPKPMPINGAPLKPEEIAIITQWIKAGAIMPADAAQ